MSIISEAYFTHVDTKWDYVGQFGGSFGSTSFPRYEAQLPNVSGVRRTRQN